MKLIFILFSVMIAVCHGVSVDYYFGIKELDLEDKTKNMTTIKPIEHERSQPKNRRTNTIMKHSEKNVKPISIGNETEHDNDSDYEKYEELSDVEYKINKKTSKNNKPKNVNSNNADSRIIEVGYDTNVIIRQGGSEISQLKSLEDIFKDYANPGGHLMTTPYLGLRNTFKNNYSSKSQTEFDKNKIVILKNTTDLYQNSEKISIDFYNLVPASNVINDENDDTGSYYLPDNIWYVPENSPCWDLPILYGELSQSMLHTDVFLVYPGTLTNVIETAEETSTASRPMFIPVSQTMNKWCAAGPCYGDHTLCLFSDKTNSKLCKRGYKVYAPTMVEQIGLVNSINSIRNRIANRESQTYKHLPKGSNINQLIYDFDLERMAEAWLQQCLPGPAACSALDGNYVTQLECTKHAEYCCIDSFKTEKASKCIPQYECYVEHIIGCIHVWFLSAGKKLTATDVECGHITADTFNTVQLFWGGTSKIGCAYGKYPNGDVRVVCNFAPGAPFYRETKYYCGFIAHNEIMRNFTTRITDQDFLDRLGIPLIPVNNYNINIAEMSSHHANYSLRFSDIDILAKIYKRKWIRNEFNQNSNGTLGLIARLVTKYTFGENGGSQCDMNEAIYIPGEPGSKCVERGRRFHALCYDFRDPTPGYRLVAVVAPVALFSLILYDLFSGVVRQTNY